MTPLALANGEGTWKQPWCPTKLNQNGEYVAELNATHCDRLVVLHRAAKAIARQVQRRFMGALSPGHGMKVGYHQKPSLSRMHIHLISDDLDGRGMKTKKHRDSFATDFFVPVDAVLEQARRTLD